jgi:hypothetical protein
MKIAAATLVLAAVGADGGPGGSAAAEPLRVEYRYIQAMTCKGNRRVRIDPDGRVYADVATRDCLSGEDWNGPWPTQPVRSLSAAQMARLLREVSRSGFFDLPARIERLATDGYREELDVSVGDRRHSVVVEHADAPPAFIRVRDAVLALAGMR